MHVPQSVRRLLCQSNAQMSKTRKTSDPGVNLYSFNLPTFIQFHPLSFTFIHFHSLSFTFIHFHAPLFTFIHFQFLSIHTSIHQKCSFIKNVYSYILSQPVTHISIFSQLKRFYQMRVKFSCHTFKRLKEKIKKKTEFAPILVPPNLRKNERVNE